MDISSTGDIELLVNSFYEQVRKDEVIGPIFNEIIGDDWSRHLPIMYNFWGLILLNNGDYRGNTIKKHLEIDKKITLEDAHYTRWVTLWNNKVDSLYNGPVADEAKKRAALMINLIKMKVSWNREGKNIM